MKKNKSSDTFLPYVVVVGVVAIVAIVSLFLWSGRIEGAPIFSPMAEDQGGCSDTDPINDVNKRGVVKKAYTLYEDYCLDGRLLYQHYCDATYVKLSAPWDCEYGCNRGACIERQ